MTYREFEALMEFKGQMSGDLTHSDYEEIKDFMRKENG
jgi:hypothetical protein